MRLLIALVTALAVSSIAMVSAMDLVFNDLPCTQTDCTGSAVPVTTLQSSFQTLVQEFVDKKILSLLKASTLSEFMYSSLNSASGKDMKCLADDAYTRGVGILLALAPPQVPASSSVAARMQNTVKYTMHSMFGKQVNSASEVATLDNVAEKWTTTECYTYLPGNDQVCEVLACAFYSSFTLDYVYGKYLTCCSNYYGTWWPIYCG